MLQTCKFLLFIKLETAKHIKKKSIHICVCALTFRSRSDDQTKGGVGGPESSFGGDIQTSDVKRTLDVGTVDDVFNICHSLKI